MSSTARRGITAAGALALCLALSSCGADEQDGGSAAGAGPSSSAATSAGSSAGSASSSSALSTEHNKVDTTFAQDMIVHHEGAIDMAGLAADRSESEEVTKLADQILATQGPEIETMRTLLAVWGEEAPAAADEHGDHGGHGEEGEGEGGEASAEGMPGMMSADAMAELEAASGEEFDRLFLEGMIEHHEGAIEMSAEELSKGVNPQAKDLARQITEAQEAEIGRMGDLLEQL